MSNTSDAKSSYLIESLIALTESGIFSTLAFFFPPTHLGTVFSFVPFQNDENLFNRFPDWPGLHIRWLYIIFFQDVCELLNGLDIVKSLLSHSFVLDLQHRPWFEVDAVALRLVLVQPHEDVNPHPSRGSDTVCYVNVLIRPSSVHFSDPSTFLSDLHGLLDRVHPTFNCQNLVPREVEVADERNRPIIVGFDLQVWS